MYDAPRNGTFLSDFLTFRFFPKNKNGPFRGEVSVWGHFSGYQILALFFNFSGLRTNFGGSKNRGRHRFSERFLVRHRFSWDFTKSVDFCTFQLIFALFVRFSGNRSISALFSGFSGNQPISALFRGLQGVVQGPAGSDFGTSWLRFWDLLAPILDPLATPGIQDLRVWLRVSPGPAQGPILGPPGSGPLAQVQDPWILWPTPTWYLLASISRRELATQHTWTLCHHGCSLPHLTSQMTPSSPDYCVIELTCRSS